MDLITPILKKAGICIEESCNWPATQFITKNINGMRVCLLFCDEHAQEYENFESQELYPGDWYSKDPETNVNELKEEMDKDKMPEDKPNYNIW